jgi:hypothetical protein
MLSLGIGCQISQELLLLLLLQLLQLLLLPLQLLLLMLVLLMLMLLMLLLLLLLLLLHASGYCDVSLRCPWQLHLLAVQETPSTR